MFIIKHYLLLYLLYSEPTSLVGISYPVQYLYLYTVVLYIVPRTIYHSLILKDDVVFRFYWFGVELWMTGHTKLTEQIAIHYTYRFVSRMVQSRHSYCKPSFIAKSEPIPYLIVLSNPYSFFDVIGIVNIYCWYLYTILFLITKSFKFFKYSHSSFFKG